MIEAFKFNSGFENRAVKVSKLMIDIDEFSFVHDDETMKNELTLDTNFSSKLRQKRRRKNRINERTSIRRRQIVENMNVIEKLIQLQKKNWLKSRINLIKFKKIDILRFNASIANESEFLPITIKNFSNDFELYITKAIRIFVVKTSVIVDDMLAKKRTIKFKNTESYHDKIVKKHWNYIQNVNTTFKMIFENVQTYKQKIVYAIEFLKTNLKMNDIDMKKSIFLRFLFLNNIVDFC